MTQANSSGVLGTWVREQATFAKKRLASCWLALSSILGSYRELEQIGIRLADQMALLDVQRISHSSKASRLLSYRAPRRYHRLKFDEAPELLHLIQVNTDIVAQEEPAPFRYYELDSCRYVEGCT